MFQFIRSRVSLGLFLVSTVNTLIFPAVKESVSGIWIQGSRSSVSSPCLTDNGDDIPDIGPNYKDIFDSGPDHPPLELTFNDDNTFQGRAEVSYYAVICTK